MRATIRRAGRLARRPASVPLLALAAAALAGCSGEGADERAVARRAVDAVEATLPAGAEAVSLLGDTLYPPELPGPVREERERQLREARAAYEADPDDPDAIIWLGRRTAYLGRYRDAIRIFTEGADRHPDDPRLLRHRGHRFITVRELGRAVEDLQRAAEMIRGTEDEVEPDGLPNARNVPTSTLQGNIWYHLGLAHYLRGEFEAALDAYRECLDVSTNPDMLVATSHWLYMTLRRLGRDAEAESVLAPIRRDLDVIENHGYHRLLLMYRGALAADEVRAAADGGLGEATVGYGIANWHLYNDRQGEAVEGFRRVLETGQWAAFGYIAAEADLARRLSTL